MLAKMHRLFCAGLHGYPKTRMLIEHIQPLYDAA